MDYGRGPGPLSAKPRGIGAVEVPDASTDDGASDGAQEGGHGGRPVARDSAEGGANC